MNVQKFFTSSVLLVGIAGLWFAPTAFAQTCCEPDIWGQDPPDRVCPGPPDGSIQIQDILTALDCATGRLDQQNCPEAFARCDVNCDGNIDFVDVAAVEQAFRGIPNPCTDIVTGACCSDSPDVPGCVLATEVGLAPLCSEILGGTYQGDGTTCNPSLCDCNHNSIPDADDITSGTSDDCNANGLPDECELGACCFQVKTCEGGSNPGDLCGGDGTAACFNGGTCTGPEVQACATTKQAECEDVSVGGTYLGPCETCPKQSAGLIREGDGSVFIHIIGPPVDCPVAGGTLAGVPPDCNDSPPYIDAWETASGGVVCHDFGSAETNPIPADFFGPGSDPFDGVVCLDGVPLGPTVFGDFGDADTLISRSADPFDRCDAPSATESSVAIEIVALSLVSTNPITVTFNGGQNPEQWDVAVDLSQISPVAGTLTAVKDDYNGGTYTSVLFVQPRFRFINVLVPATQKVLDTGMEGIPPVNLSQTAPAPWVTDIDPNLGLSVDLCSHFHGGIENTVLFPAGDKDFDGIPDICQVIDIPAASQWGLTAMVLLLVTMGTVLIQRGRKLGTTVE